MCLNLEKMSKNFIVKKITEDTIYEVVQLCKGNTNFYQYSKSKATIEAVKEDFVSLPPNKDLKDKYYIGFYKENKLYAIMDLLLQYPNKETAYIGLFLVDRKFHRKGIGTEIIKETTNFLEKTGFSYVQLGCIKENREGNCFWIKNLFSPMDKEVEQDDGVIISCMNRKLK